MSATAPDWAVAADAAREADARAAAGMMGAAPDAVMTGGAATEIAFRERAPGAAIIHIGAPFRVNSASPLFSPILLGGDATATAIERDGMLKRASSSISICTRGLSCSPMALRCRCVRGALGRTPSGGHGARPAFRRSSCRAGPRTLRRRRPCWKSSTRRSRRGDRRTRRCSARRKGMRAREDTRAPVFWAGWMVSARRRKPRRRETEKTEKKR